MNQSDGISPPESEEEEQRDQVVVPARVPNLFFSTEVAKSVAEADVIFITVNTPTKTKGLGAGSATDVTALEGATREIALHAKPGAILVEKSTVPCGTAELIMDTVSTAFVFIFDYFYTGLCQLIIAPDPSTRSKIRGLVESGISGRGNGNQGSSES